MGARHRRLARQAAARLSAVAASIVAAAALLVWLPTGPLAPGWAKRAGTPSSLLPTAAAVRVSTSSPAGASASSPASGVAPTNFNAPVTGTVSQSRLGSGLVRVELHLALAGQALSALDIRLDGQPLGGGGVEMTSSRVTLGTPSDSSRYAGLVTALEGTTSKRW